MPGSTGRSGSERASFRAREPWSPTICELNVAAADDYFGTPTTHDVVAEADEQASRQGAALAPMPPKLLSARSRRRRLICNPGAILAAEHYVPPAAPRAPAMNVAGKLICSPVWAHRVRHVGYNQVATGRNPMRPTRPPTCIENLLVVLQVIGSILSDRQRRVPTTGDRPRIRLAVLALLRLSGTGLALSCRGSADALASARPVSGSRLGSVDWSMLRWCGPQARWDHIVAGGRCPVGVAT